jgi:hypothetical protein
MSAIFENELMPKKFALHHPLPGKSEAISSRSFTPFLLWNPIAFD